MIAPDSLTRARTLLLVLTGDNDQLCSGAPTFDDIPASEIIGSRGQRAIEVTLKTAICFLGCVEAAETDANEKLRISDDARVATMEKEFQRQAVCTVSVCSRADVDTTQICTFGLRRAMQRVLDREDHNACGS